MDYDYFFGVQANQYTFYRVPKLFFIQNCCPNMSTDAKLLYGMLLDRVNLSAKNGWQDEKGTGEYHLYHRWNMSNMDCAENKATKLLDNLKNRFGLIKRKQQCLRKPNLIW